MSNETTRNHKEWLAEVVWQCTWLSPPARMIFHALQTLHIRKVRVSLLTPWTHDCWFGDKSWHMEKNLKAWSHARVGVIVAIDSLNTTGKNSIDAPTFSNTTTKGGYPNHNLMENVLTGQSLHIIWLKSKIVKHLSHAEVSSWPIRMMLIRGYPYFWQWTCKVIHVE